MNRILTLLATLLLLGCPNQKPPLEREVVAYVALDRLYAQPILDAFTEDTGIEVLAKWDTEATKTTGLVEAIRAESNRPRCDVFWNNEVSQTIALAREGLLAPYDSPLAADLPDHARDPEHRWTGFAARARVLIVNTDRVPEDRRPTGYRDLLDPEWAGQCGIAKPLFGTTATHVAAWWASMGPEATQEHLAALKANGVVICASNADVKDRVAQGELAFGWTDTDDANLAILDGAPVAIVFPDQADDAPGTLLIPNTVAILRDAPHPRPAHVLIDYLLRPEVEAALARARSAQVPLRAGLARPDWIPETLRTLSTTWDEVTDAFAPSRDHVRGVFLDGS